jgi:hypothetical protein
MLRRLQKALARLRIPSVRCPADDGPELRVARALENISTLIRPGRVGYATIWDFNAYVQCRRLENGAMRCEAAGSLLQPTLANLLLRENLNVLTDRGWELEADFGNFVQVFQPDASIDSISTIIVTTLRHAYTADVDALETRTSWIKDEPHPPRNGYTQNLAGLVNDAPAMLPTSVRTVADVHAALEAASEPRLSVAGNDNLPSEQASAQVQTLAELLSLFADTVAAEIQRLRINTDDYSYTVFAADIGYVQCRPGRGDSLYCEALAPESWPDIERLVPPEHLAMLKTFGYADPGRTPNYSKLYMLDEMTDQQIAGEILKILFHVYGYRAATDLEIEAV